MLLWVKKMHEAVKRARIATVFLFFANGLSVSVLTPRLADLQISLGMNDLQLGAVLSVGAAGGLVFGPLAAPGIKKFGSGPLAMLALIVMIPLLPLLGIVPSAVLLGGVIFGIGAVDAVMDAAQNAHGLEVQRIYQRSIINNMHAFWALGTVVGALIGALTLALNISLTLSLVFVSLVIGVGLVITFTWVLGRDHSNEETSKDLATSLERQEVEQLDPSSLVLSPPTHISRFAISSTLGLIGLLTVLAVTVEDVPQRWSSIYLTDIGVSSGNVGFGVVVFTISLTLGRFIGDFFVNRFGERLVAQVSMTITALALSAALISDSAIAFLASCIVVGFGVATLFPAAMHAATYVPGISPGSAITVVSWISRAGFVFAPLIVGLVSDTIGVQWGISLAVVAAVIIIPLAQLLRPRQAHGES